MVVVIAPIAAPSREICIVYNRVLYMKAKKEEGEGSGEVGGIGLYRVSLRQPEFHNPMLDRYRRCLRSRNSKLDSCYL
jgi:hypothetical protein